MQPDDCNYSFMETIRDEYMDNLLLVAKDKGFVLTQFEQEEIEQAFEDGFARGFVFCKREEWKKK